MGNRFKGKTVVVTGASSGIGMAAARLFKAEGAEVVCLARRAVNDFECIPTDVTDEEAVFSAVEKIMRGHGRIDVLVNNAGMGISGAVEDTSLPDAKAIFDVNFFGALNVIKAAVPARRRGYNYQCKLRGGRACHSLSVLLFGDEGGALLAFVRASQRGRAFQHKGGLRAPGRC